MSLDTHVLHGFFATLEKLANGVSADEALESAKVLSESKRSKLRRYVDAGVVGGALTPGVELAGQFAEHAGNATKNRVAAGLKGARLTKGQLAKSVTRGVLGGAAVRAGQEGLQTQRAKDTYRRFMQQETA